MRLEPWTVPAAVLVGAVNASWVAVPVAAVVWGAWSWWRGRIEKFT